MLFQNTTQLPNFLFDEYLTKLTEAEIKILLVISRQTLGWFNGKTGKRKQRDRITQYQFQKKAGLVKRTITNAIKSLISQNLIVVTDYNQNQVHDACSRKGKSYLYYGLSQPAHLRTDTKEQKVLALAQGKPHNKNNYKKTTTTKTSNTADLIPIGLYLQQNQKAYR